MRRHFLLLKAPHSNIAAHETTGWILVLMIPELGVRGLATAHMRRHGSRRQRMCMLNNSRPDTSAAAMPCPATPPALLGAVLVTMRFIGWQSDQNPPLPLLLDVLGMSICRQCHLGLAAPRFRAQSAGMWVTWRRHFSVSQGNSQRPHMVSL